MKRGVNASSECIHPGQPVKSDFRACIATAKNIELGQPAQSASTALGRYFLLLTNFPSVNGTSILLDSVVYLYEMDIYGSMLMR